MSGSTTLDSITEVSEYGGWCWSRRAKIQIAVGSSGYADATMKVKFKAIYEDLLFDGAPSYQNLTPGNVYRVISMEVDSVRVMDDQGEPVLFPSSWFSVIDSQWPTDWVIITGPDGEHYIGPPVFWENYFWERYFDGDREAIQTLKRRLREWNKYES